jgi:hypothetical protein
MRKQQRPNAMKRRPTKRAFDHSGSRFDDFLEEEGIRAEVDAVAAKRLLAWELRVRASKHFNNDLSG